MKRPGLPGFLRRLLVVLGCLGLAAAAGYGFGKSKRASDLHVSPNSREAAKPEPGALEGWKAEAVWSAAQADRLASLLIEQAKRSPVPSGDWELQAEFRRVFVAMPAERFKELNAVFLRLDAADGDEQSESLSAVWAVMLEEWAAKDGRAAMNAGGPGDFENLFRAWAATDLDGLLAWIEEGRKSSTHSGFRWASSMGFPIDALDDVAEKDSARLEKIIADMPASEAMSVIRYFATRWSTNPERRARVLDLAERHHCLAEVRQSLVGHWQSKEPQAALDFIAALDVPPEEKANLDALALSGRMKTEPAAAMALWVERNGNQMPPGWLVSNVKDWVSQDQDGSIDWLKQAPEGRQRDQFCCAAVDVLTDKAADSSATTPLALMIRDDKLRLKALQWIYRDCRKEGSGTAAKWLADVPEADRLAVIADPQ